MARRGGGAEASCTQTHTDQGWRRKGTQQDTGRKSNASSRIGARWGNESWRDDELRRAGTSRHRKRREPCPAGAGIVRWDRANLA